MDTEITKDNGANIVPANAWQNFKNLLDRTNRENPRKADVAALDQMLRDDPSLFPPGNLTVSTVKDLVERIRTTDAGKVILERNFFQLRKDLGYAQANALEKTLIDHVALCWLRMVTLEDSYTIRLMGGESYSTSTGDYWERRLAAVQRRYQRACETLARIRRLKLPIVQMNIAANGGRQVNTLECKDTKAHFKKGDRP